MSFLEKFQPYALLLLRCGLALVFAFHGYPKLFGDNSHILSAYQAIGLPALVVYLTGAIEFFAGIALGFGLFTPIAGLLLLVDMLAAMWKYNLNEGVYAVREYELPLVLGLASLAVAAAGGGRFSLDRLFFRKQEASSS